MQLTIIYFFLLYYIVVYIDKYSMLRSVGGGMTQQISDSARLTHTLGWPVKPMELAVPIEFTCHL